MGMRNLLRLTAATAVAAAAVALGASAPANATTAQYTVCSYTITAAHYFKNPNGDNWFLVRKGERRPGYRDATMFLNGILHRQMTPAPYAWGEVGKMVLVPGSCRI